MQWAIADEVGAPPPRERRHPCRHYWETPTQTRRPGNRNATATYTHAATAHGRSAPRQRQQTNNGCENNANRKRRTGAVGSTSTNSNWRRTHANCNNSYKTSNTADMYINNNGSNSRTKQRNWRSSDRDWGNGPKSQISDTQTATPNGETV